MMDQYTFLGVRLHSSMTMVLSDAQQRAARWVKQEYSMTTSVTAILNKTCCLNVSSIADSPCFSSFYTKTHLLSEYHNIICPPH